MALCLFDVVLIFQNEVGFVYLRTKYEDLGSPEFKCIFTGMLFSSNTIKHQTSFTCLHQVLVKMINAIRDAITIVESTM